MIRARLLENEGFRHWPEHEFLFLPSRGDTVLVYDDNHNLYRVRVTHLDHEPVQVSEPKDRTPTIVIKVEVVEDLS
jgi:3-phenylpropionate/cinnamic acid dioxygenase small subunit